MERVRRFKAIIVATVVCAVILVAAAFSVSFAAWQGTGGSATAEATGKTGQFYVEYPRYKGGEAPALLAGTYYIQIPRQSNPDVADYYAMIDNAHNSSEKMLVDVYLKVNDKIDLFLGTTRTGIPNNNGSSTENAAHDTATGTYTVNAEGYYDFYYNYGATSMYVGYTAPSTGDGSGDGETVDTTGYSNPLIVKFSDDAAPKTLYFKTASGATGLYADVQNLSAEIRVAHSSYYFNSHWTNESAPTTDGNLKKVNAANGKTINVGTKESTIVIFGFEEAWRGGTNTSTDELSLQDYAKGSINCITLHSAGKTAPTLDKFGGGGSGSGGGSADKTPATPTTTGSTTPGDDELEGVKTVRKVNAAVREKDGTYKYKNYVCVSRATRNSDSVVDNSIAFLEFIVKQTGSVPLNTVNVLGVNIVRHQANDDGSLSGGTVGTPPRLYNFESVTTLDTFGHGEKVGKGTIPGNTVEHYDDGCYCILFFGDGADMYYALDIEIIVDRECDFELTVDASNINNWQRFEQGYGAPWGFYMGGLINNVWLWDPRRTTKMSGTEIDVKYNADGETVDLTRTENLASYTSNSSTVYRPKEVDLTLTINLTAGSIAKLYFLNGTGAREDGQVAYFVPKKVTAYPANLFDKVAGSNTVYYDGQGALLDENGELEKRENLNIRIPVSGTYTFRYKGSVSERTTNCYVNNVTGEYSETNKLGETNWYAVSDFNFLIDELTIIGPGATTEDSVVTFVNTDTTKGTLSKTETTVPFLGKLKASDCPTATPNDGYSFDKWYTDEQCTIPYDFDAIVSGNMTLYAKWKGAQYDIAFDANGGKIGTATTAYFRTNTDGYLEETPANPTRAQTVGAATYDNYWNFDGWYTEETGGDKIENLATHQFTNSSAKTLYAHWTQMRFTVTLDHNYAGAPANETCVTDTSGKLTSAQLMLPTRSGYKCIGWFTAAGDGQGDKVEFGNAYNSFAQDKTLYAHWEESTATVTYYYNDDMHGNAVYMTDSDVSVKPIDPEFAGHTLVGWYKNAACTVPYTFGGSLDDDLVLYAKWSGAAYNVDGGAAVGLTKGTAGEGDAATYSGVIETRDGKAGSIGVGKTVKIYIDGKDVTVLDDPNARITHTDGVNSYAIINSEQAKGKFMVRAHLTTAGVRKVDIKFVGGDAADQIGQEITAGSAANAGFYVVGGFSNWSVYKANKLTATDVEGIYGITLPFVIPNSGKYKIVEVPSSGDLIWYDKNGVGGGNAGNNTITSTSFYVDTFKAGAARFIKNIDIYRIIFDKTPITWGSFGLPVQIHYWDKNVQAGSVDISNWDSSGNWKNWDNKNSMIVSNSNSKLYYYDVPAGVKYGGKDVKLTGVIITFKDNSSVLQSQNLTLTFEARHSYKFTYANWGDSLGGSWNGTNWWAISA